jgi:hypothetical protein
MQIAVGYERSIGHANTQQHAQRVEAYRKTVIASKTEGDERQA